MSWSEWIVLAVFIPSMGWLFVEHLKLRLRMTQIETRCQSFRDNLSEQRVHDRDSDNLTQRTLERLDRNIVRLCERNEVPYESP